MKKLILLLLVFTAVQGMGQIKGGIKLETGLTINPRHIDISDTTWAIETDTMRFIPERIGITPEEYNSSNLGIFVDCNSHDIPYLTLRKGYQAYCNQEVIDTLIQTGTVKCRLEGRTYEPVADTVWYDLEKKEYKQDLGKNKYLFEFLYDTISYEKINWRDVLWSNHELPESLDLNIKYFEVTRKIPVKLKQEKPTPEGFWIWVEKNYLK